MRYYWSRYLDAHSSDIQGKCLEVGSTATLRQHGGDAVDAEAIDLAAHSPEVTIVADLSRADNVEPDTFDCFVNQFTMHVIYDVESALYHSLRILKPGGVFLVNFPCVEYYFANGLDMGTGAPIFVHWWFTPLQIENLLRGLDLCAADYDMTICGNLFTRIAYQMNMPSEELTRREIDHVDPNHPLLICLRAVKPAGWNAQAPKYRDAWTPTAEPAKWNPVFGHYACTENSSRISPKEAWCKT